MARAKLPFAVCRLRATDLSLSWNYFPGHAHAAHRMVPGDVVRRKSKNRDERPWVAAGARARQLRDGLDLAAQTAPRNGATGLRPVEGQSRGGRNLPWCRRSWDSGPRCAQKALIVIAVEQSSRGRGIGRIRLRRIPEASADSLQGFIDEVIERGSLAHTDGWLGYDRLKAHGYWHRITFLGDHPEPAHELLPRVHLVASLLKRLLLETHQGAVSAAHLDYYLDEFTFRFNRRRSRHRGKLFFRLATQAVQVEPAPCHALESTFNAAQGHTTICRGYLSRGYPIWLNYVQNYFLATVSLSIGFPEPRWMIKSIYFRIALSSF